MRRGWLLVYGILAIAACGGATASSAPEATESAQTSATAGATEFERIVAGAPLPTTFRGLVDLVEQRTRGQATFTFIPKGRSLVRGATTFADPRIVVMVTTTEPEKVTAKDVVSHGSGVFLGFAKDAHLVEVISYDEKAGRYEFLLVEDFGLPGKTPRLRAADRNLCTACHNLGTPIFPVGLWSETVDHSPKVLAKVREAMGKPSGPLSYQGFPLPDEAIEDFVGAGLAFENAAEDASRRLVANELFATTCKGSPKCRADLARYAIFAGASLWNAGVPAKRADLTGYPAARTDFLARRGDTIRVLGPLLSDRDPLAGDALTEDHDPLRAKPLERILHRDTPDADLYGTATGFSFVGGVFTEGDAKRLREALSTMPGATPLAKFDAMTKDFVNAPWAKTDGPVSRCAILRTVFADASPPGCHRIDEASTLGAAKDDAGAPNGSAELEPFRQDCGGCHGGAVKPKFLAAPPPGKTDRDVFRSWAHCIAPVLDWTAGGRTMPPESATAARARLKDDPSRRLQMLSLARIAVEEQRALGDKALPTEKCLP